MMHRKQGASLMASSDLIYQATRAIPLEPVLLLSNHWEYYFFLLPSLSRACFIGRMALSFFANRVKQAARQKGICWGRRWGSSSPVVKTQWASGLSKCFFPPVGSGCFLTLLLTLPSARSQMLQLRGNKQLNFIYRCQQKGCTQ